MTELTRRRPLPVFRSMRRDLDELVSDFFRRPFGEGEEELPSAVWAPRMDLAENDAAYLVELDLPGVAKEDIKIDLEDNRLMVRGERKEEEREEGENYLRMERSYGNFYRSFSLPDVAKTKDIKAEFKDGVLKIRIPKSEEKKPKRIKIS